MKGMRENTCVYNFLLDNHFFMDIDGPEVQKGKVNVRLEVRKTSHMYELNFETEGTVIVQCDRCLDEMEQPVASTDKLVVKLGDEYAEEGDNVVIVPETEGIINVAWFMYEFVALAIPMKHVHAPGKCNKEMSGKLGSLLRTTPDDADDADGFATDDVDDEQEAPTDPRWNGLKKLLDNN